LIAEGHSNEEIARSLGIAPETVKSDVKNIFDKLSVEKRAQAPPARRRRKTPSPPQSDRKFRATTPFSPKNNREFTTAVASAPRLVTRKVRPRKAVVLSARNAH